MASGLDELDQRRQAAGSGNRRYVPAPKHPKAPLIGDGLTQDAVDEASAEPAVDLRVAANRQEPPTEVPAPGTRRSSRVRPTQVHLDQASEDHLSAIRKRAVMTDVAITNSAVLRLALAELVERRGHEGIVTLFAQDATQPRPGRPRSC